MLSDVDYKEIIFTGENVDVTILADITDAEDTDENFLVLKKEVNSAKEINLFSWIYNQRYTQNEFNFFALNNNLSVEVKEKDGSSLTTYGV